MDRFKAVMRTAARLMLSGDSVFCPVAHSHPIETEVPYASGHEFWMKQDLAILVHCTKVVVLCLQGWSASAGIAEEIAKANELGIPVEYIFE